MSWIQKLCQVYDVMSEAEDCGLMLVGFTQKKIKYNIVLSAEGEFVTAQELPKEEQLYVVPSTPQAEGRVGAAGAPFPLADGLKYVVPGEREENIRFEMYLEQLSQWCKSSGAPRCLKILRDYLQKRTLFQDISSVQELKLKYNQDGSGADAKSFACFSVQTLDGDSRLWMREDVKESWVQYLATQAEGKPGLCYALGKILPISEKHPKFSGNAKLISAEDAGYPFQYKGRFAEDRSSVTVSSFISGRAHNALKWLMENQGFSRYGMQIVGWNVDQPALETGNIRASAEKADDEDDISDDTDEAKTKIDAFDGYARALRDAVKGDYAQLDKFSQDEKITAEYKKRRNEIVIMAMQAATPGRMSITYYQEMPGNVYVENLQDWEHKCRWELPGREEPNPTWIDICRAVMGQDAVAMAKRDFRCEKAATKQIREIQMRLLACTVNKKALPEDMVQAAFRRGINPSGFTDDKGSWTGFYWQQCVAVACAMIRKLYFDKENRELSPELDMSARNRDYLFGRLLAVAHKLEMDTMSPKERNKVKTAAVQSMTAFVQNPENVWMHLYCKLLPKLKEVGADGRSARRYQRLFGEIETLFLPNERISRLPLSYLFLIGFSAQLRELYLPKEERQGEGELPPYTLPVSRDELFGCLLAVADDCQWNAEAEEKKGFPISAQDGATNAMRLTASFMAKPCTAWAHIHDKLIPYLEKLGVEKGTRVQNLLRSIEQRFALVERLSDAPLNSGFLHGYLSMRRALTVKGGLDSECWRSPKEQPEEIFSREAAFGALLALENQVERRVLDMDPEPAHNRFSNAMRFLQRASRRPNEVLPYLMERMEPYTNTLRTRREIDKERMRLQKRIDENGWNSAEPLHPGYLHTFYTYKFNTTNRKEK